MGRLEPSCCSAGSQEWEPQPGPKRLTCICLRMLMCLGDVSGSWEGGSGASSWAQRQQRLPGGRGRPFSGLQGWLTLGTRRWQALEAAAACVGGRALNSREQATCTGCMDLQASLLSTGPNASNISDGQDNLTLAGESS